MAAGLKAWSTTPASNASADANVNWSEGQLAPTLNNSARAMMAALAAFYDQIGGAATMGGSSNAYTITNNAVGAWSSYASGDIIMLKANHTNSGAATVNVDALGAETIKTADGGDVAAGDLVSGGFYLLAYDGTNFQVINTIGGGSYQPLDATLLAIAALAGASGNVAYWTGTDTFSLAASSAAGRTLWNFTDPNADQIIFWDDSAVSLVGLTLGTGLSITTTTLNLATSLQTLAGITLASGVSTFLATPSSANLAALVTDETGSGALVFATSPTLVTPALGTPSSATLTNAIGLPIASGVSGLGTGVATFLATPSSANLLAAVTNETGTGALVFATSPTLVTPALGTPSSGTLTSCAGLPVSSGISGLGTGVATFLATPSSANLIAAITDETGSGALVFGTSPTIATPTINGGSASLRPQLSGESSGTITTASANKLLQLAGDITAPNSVFTAPDTMILDPGASNRTITRGSGVTMYVNGVDSASATVLANTLASLHYRSASVCILSGSGVS